MNSRRLIPWAVAAISAATVLVLPTAEVSAATTHSGVRCTIVGTSRNDVLRGTSLRDVICGRGGSDVIYGNGGNDVIDGGTGNDTIDGGTGNDVIDGGTGNDTMIGGPGSDTLGGGSGTDLVSYATSTRAVNVSLDGRRNDGAPGEADLITATENLLGGPGNDVLTGNSGANSLRGANGNDVVNGDSGNDTVVGGNGIDILEGGLGNDIVGGDAGNDLVNGGDGNDLLLGGAGDDDISGGSGDDDLTGDDGADDLDGGPGINPCHTDLADIPDPETCGDVTAPRIVDFSFSPSSINTASSEVVVTVTVRVRDDLSGVSSTTNAVNVSFASPYGVGRSNYCSWGHSIAVGSSMDMTCAIPIVFPRYSHVGIWEVSEIVLIDEVGNARSAGRLDWGYQRSVAEIVPPGVNLRLRNGPT